MELKNKSTAHIKTLKSILAKLDDCEDLSDQSKTQLSAIKQECTEINSHGKAVDKLLRDAYSPELAIC